MLITESTRGSRSSSRVNTTGDRSVFIITDSLSSLSPLSALLALNSPAFLRSYAIYLGRLALCTHCSESNAENATPSTIIIYQHIGNILSVLTTSSSKCTCLLDQREKYLTPIRPSRHALHVNATLEHCQSPSSWSRAHRLTIKVFVLSNHRSISIKSLYM